MTETNKSILNMIKDGVSIDKKVTPRIYVSSLSRNSFHDQINLPRALELDFYLDSNMNL